MRNFKKFLTLVLAVMMVVSAMSFTTAAAFEDVAADNEYLAEAIDLLNYMGVAKGVSETKFGTDELVTRQQFALFIYRMMKGGKDAPANGANSTNFTDLVDPTYNYAISWAYQNNIVSGRTSTTFDPKGAITLQEAYAMIVRALEYEADGEKLAYPFGYIEVAEKETVNLPEGLASSVDATDALTRGDMAILLYNAFFAEVGVAEVKYEERTLSDSSVVLVEKEDYPRLCEKFFGVKEVEYQAVGTPHFSSNITDVDGTNHVYENTFDLGYDAILFKRVDTDVNIPAPADAYIKAEDISVDAKDLDKYFLANFTLFVTLDEDDNNAIEKVLYADSKMTTKTVTDIKFGTVSSNKADSYYFVDANADGINDSNTKLLSGKATADGETFYFFNAPYSYVAPTYDTKLNEDEKYELKNAENIGEIIIEVDDLEDGTFIAYTNEMVIPSLKADYDASGYYRANALTLAGKYDAIYYDGLYEADLYDVDGDGCYDYINYKPYGFFQVNTDEDYAFFDYETTGKLYNGVIPEVYTEGATLLGEKFEDEDFVIGYYSKDANTIKVAEVIKPVTAKIKSFSKADLTVTLTDGTTANVADAWKYVKNFWPATIQYDTDLYADTIDYTNAEYKNLLAAANIDDDEIDLYIYDGVVLYEEGAQSAALTFTENLLIPTADKNGRQAIEQFNTAAGKMMTYIYAWVDGETKWVPVETDDEIVYPVIATSGTIDPAYFEELCTYSVGADGVYTVTALAGDIDPDDKTTYQGINTVATDLLDDEDDEIQFIAKNIPNVLLKKQISTRFVLADYTDATATPSIITNLLSYTDVATGKTYNPLVNLTDATRIVIKNNKFTTDSDPSNDEVEFVEYDITTLTTSSEVVLNNVSVVLANDVDQTNREDLLLLYGEAYDFDLKGIASTTGYRIIRNSDPYVDENGYYRNSYNVLNPFTGKIETIAGNKTAASASGINSTAIAVGAMVDLKDGKINDVQGTVVDTFNGTVNAVHPVDGIAPNYDAQAGLVWIVDYDTKDNVIVVADVVTTPTTNWYDVVETGSFTVDNNTVVTLLKHEKASDLVAWGNFSTLTLADIAAPKNEMKCYNTKVPSYVPVDPDGVPNSGDEYQVVDTSKAYKTGYAKYLKAYIVTENETNLDEGELNKVTFIMVVANGGEDLAHLTTNKRP